jgi:SAM-dependent methyltransferase
MKKIISFLLRSVPRPVLQRFVGLGTKTAALLLKGDKVECTVCDKKFSKFLPFGRVESRENALCPNCLSLERHRLIATFLKEKTNFYKDHLKVLHVAPEICFKKQFQELKNLNYYTADLISPWADIRLDIQDNKQPDNTYDVVMCNHVLEHVESDVKALKEFYRILKPGGWAILQSPQDWSLDTTYEDPTITDPKEREIHFKQDDHWRIYGKDYAKRLEEGGFTVIENDFVKSLNPEEIFRHGYDKNEIIYLCKKEA